MFGKIFGKPKEQPSVRSSLDKLSETEEMLEKKLKLLEKKVAAELQKAQQFSKLKNKRAAIQCLKKKKMYESQVEVVSNYILRIQEQQLTLETAGVNLDVMGAMKESVTTMKHMQKQTNIDDVDKTLDDINEQTENMKMIQDALSQPMGAAAEFDEDDLLNELEELEALELDEALLQPAVVAPAAPAAPSRLTDAAGPSTSSQMPSVPTRAPAAPAQRGRVRSEEEEELDKLRAEMAL